MRLGKAIMTDLRSCEITNPSLILADSFFGEKPEC